MNTFLTRSTLPCLLIVWAALSGAATARNGDVFYIADQDTDGVDELYHVDDRTGEVTRLNSPLVAGGDVTDFEADRRGRRVVYLADQDTDDDFELYGVELSTGEVTRLNDALLSEQDVYPDFHIGPRGRTVAFTAGHWTDTDDAAGTGDIRELFSANLKTGVTTRIGGGLALYTGSFLDDYRIGPRGRRVFYQAEGDTEGVRELFGAKLSTGEPTRLNAQLVDGGDVSNFQVGPRGRRVVYSADQDTDSVVELYLVRLGSGAVTRLNETLVDGGDVSHGFLIGAKGRGVIYAADQETDGVTELYRVKLNSGAVTRLHEPLAADADVELFRIGPRERDVVFKLDVAGVTELRHADLRTGDVVQINEPLGDLSAISLFEVGAKRRSAWFTSDQDIDGVSELFHVDLKTGDMQKVNPSLDVDRDVNNYRSDPWDRRGRRAAYIADQDFDGVGDLYHADLTTDTLTRLNPNLVEGGDVDSVAFDRGGRSLVYRADQETDAARELYRVELKTGEVSKLNLPLASGGSVSGFLVIGS